MEDKTVSLIILAILVVWERTCSYLLNKKGKIMDIIDIIDQALIYLKWLLKVMKKKRSTK